MMFNTRSRCVLAPVRSFCWLTDTARQGTAAPPVASFKYEVIAFARSWRLVVSGSRNKIMPMLVTSNESNSCRWHIALCLVKVSVYVLSGRSADRIMSVVSISRRCVNMQ